jgi:biotin synthase
VAIHDLLNKTRLSESDILILLDANGVERTQLFEHSAAIKEQYVKNIVYLRGLIEISNHCSKDCFYCGIRRSNKKVLRYDLSDDEVLAAAQFAWKNRYGSIVIQSGELISKKNTDRISALLEKIMEATNQELRVTLSCGEQSLQTYEKWKAAGASRYLLRIETTNRELYLKLHPKNKKHAYDERLECLYRLKDAGYQLGTGVMIGLPFQTREHLAADLLWMNQLNIDMVGMGPYLEHQDTPLYPLRDQLLPKEERFDLSLKMIAILRIMMKNINIAATTAMQSIEKLGREKAIKVGANVFMPNITPGIYRDNYRLYDNKPCTDENAEDCGQCVEVRMALTGHQIGWDSWGDSAHYQPKAAE